MAALFRVLLSPDQAVAQLLHVCRVCGGLPGQDASVDSRMQGFHSASQHLRVSGQLGHIPGHTEGRRTDRLQEANRWLLNVFNKHIRRLVLLLPSTRGPYLTASPASRRALAVPPEATRDRPTSTSFLAKSTSPVLSDTLRRAERRD